jgi:hypothetical protein
MSDIPVGAWQELTKNCLPLFANVWSTFGHVWRTYSIDCRSWLIEYLRDGVASKNNVDLTKGSYLPRYSRLFPTYLPFDSHLSPRCTFLVPFVFVSMLTLLNPNSARLQSAPTFRDCLLFISYLWKPPTASFKICQPTKGGQPLNSAMQGAGLEARCQQILCIAKWT